MLPKFELQVVPDTQDNQDGIAENAFSVNGDPWLLVSFCMLQAVSYSDE